MMGRALESCGRPGVRSRATGASFGSAALVAGVLLLGGCTGAPRSADSEQVAPDPVISAEQTAAIADGEASATEYEAAYRRYLGCMSQAGHEVIEKGKDRSVYDYAVAETGLEADATCYALEFEHVDILWQLAHEDESRSADTLRDCLRARGLEPAATMDEIYAQMEAAGMTVGECV